MEAVKASVMTIRQTAREYGFPETGLRNLVKRGAFPVIKCGNRCYVSRTVFETFIEKGGQLHGEN